MQITYGNADQFKGLKLFPKDGGDPVRLAGKATLYGGEQVLLLSDNRWLTPNQVASRYTPANEDLRGAILDKYLDEIEAMGGRIVHEDDGEPATVVFEVHGNAYCATFYMTENDFIISLFQYRDISPDGDYSNMQPIDSKSIKWRNIPLDKLRQTPQFSNMSPEDFAKAMFSRYGFLGVVR